MRPTANVRRRCEQSRGKYAVRPSGEATRSCPHWSETVSCITATCLADAASLMLTVRSPWLATRRSARLRKSQCEQDEQRSGLTHEAGWYARSWAGASSSFRNRGERPFCHSERSEESLLSRQLPWGSSRTHRRRRSVEPEVLWKDVGSTLTISFREFRQKSRLVLSRQILRKSSTRLSAGLCACAVPPMKS